MSKMSELDLCVDELRNAAQSLTAVADSLAILFSDNADAPAEAPKAEEPKPITLEQVRAVLAEKSRDGHTAKVRELLGKYGATKLSEINPIEYPALLAEAEVL